MWNSFDLAVVEILNLNIKAFCGLIDCESRVIAILHLAFPRYWLGLLFAIETKCAVFIAPVLSAIRIGANNRSRIHHAVEWMQVLKAIGVSACVVLVRVDRALKGGPSIIPSSRTFTNFAVVMLHLVLVDAENDIWIAGHFLVFLSHAINALLQLVALVVRCDVPLVILVVIALHAVPLDGTIIIFADANIFAALT